MERGREVSPSQAERAGLLSRERRAMKRARPFRKHRRIPLPRQRGGPHEILKRKKRYRDQILRREMEEALEDAGKQGEEESGDDP